MDTMSLKIVQDEDPKNATFIFMNEDHTLGNSLRYILSKHPSVSFVGYSVPHPYEPKMHLRLQTNGPPAKDVLLEGAKQLKMLATHLKSQYVEEEKRQSS
ncbi:putative DNA-directed RNA polymerases I and III 16 kDa polypeptide [Monocercomonoides exilis]|uniref:putative DNA-directed RNA polymerases I and III 16 kDa polypeptide n=1 Tax=Monocercomonoides exilis TaxID=2049356 RepID=UPI003559E399|nr:putative DNA-directed RNA polymerases I and III 16 kDa polypeptide [Monocercomonoides exilis]|eukprot:MONOS_10117.1-p1 / transcript=MONOS_10117.1 / gene=MONOS_10117 / organism=Monocercomonoides_exilis_PA203 / gene_product=DNA-directed RNA polymerases I and III 16 kDa polypeptide / transcript_product=DNA-directed RNA polymerases I and III 16 kDa polypeptide / location=Mono_scaffold00445:28366-28833(+) / protein_length=99 / sequence_SO=supercontig / SO=protein_coding / is_pseudo=false